MKKIILISAICALCTRAQSQSWNLAGNAATNPSTNFIGTTDNKNLKIRTNNTIRINITNSGKIGIGNFTPSFKLDVKGGSINTDSLYRIRGKIVLLNNDSSGFWGNFFAGPNSGNQNAVTATGNRGNVGVGLNSLPGIVSGVYNTALGANAGLNNISGDRNTLIGYNAGIGVNADNNTLIGVGTGTTTGTDNTFAGREAGGVNSSGSNNVFIGSQAGNTNDIGGNNIAIGRNANVGNDLIYATVIGSGASVTSSHCMVLGSMDQHVGIGTTAPEKNFVVSSGDSTTLRIATTSTNDIHLDFKRGGSGAYDWRITNTGGIFTLSRSDDDLATVTKCFQMSTNFFRPAVDNIASLGNASNRWTTIYASNGTINTSDARDKKEIKDLNYGMDAIMKLHPVSFQWKNSEDNKTKLGLIAQELQQVIPETVVDEEWTEDEISGRRKVKAERLGVYYSDLIPVLVKGMQEMNATNEELKMENAELKSAIEMIKTVLSVEQRQKLNDLKDEVAFDIFPNPFSQQTTCTWSLKQDGSPAYIMIANLKGDIIKTIMLTEKNGKINFNANEFPAGVYSITLMQDEKIKAGKQMTITR